MPQPLNIERPGWVYKAGKSLLRPTLKLFYRPRITGIGNVPKTGPVLIVSNHLGTLDTLLIPAHIPRYVRFLAKSELFTGRIRNWFFTSVGAVPVFRAAGSAAENSLNAGRKVLETGGVFAIFPEGTRSVNGKINRGRPGAAWLALNTDAVVIPVGLIGTDLKRDSAGKRVKVEMRVGKAVDLTGLTEKAPGAARKEATERIMRAITNLSEQASSKEFAAGSQDA